MGRSCKSSLKKLHRPARYRFTRPRLAWHYRCHAWPKGFAIHVGAHWGGRRRIRKSTSGGLAQWGRHTITICSKTQNLVAQSPGESELHGCVRGACEALGLQSRVKDFNAHPDMLMMIDANAVKGIIERNWLCRVRHIDTAHLWLQQSQARRLLPLKKAQGSSNPADVMTENLTDTETFEYIGMRDMDVVSGRSGAAAQLHNIQARKGINGHSWDQAGKKGLWRTSRHLEKDIVHTYARCWWTPPRTRHHDHAGY